MPPPPHDVDQSEILACLDEIVFYVDVEGRVFFVSKSLDRILGHSSAAIADGESHWELWHPEDLATGLDISPNVIEGRSVSRLVHRLKHVDGTYRTFESTARPTRLPNGEPGMVVVCRDQTSVIADDEQTSELESQLLNAERTGDLALIAGGGAHDFGNILQGMMASVELARDASSDRPHAMDHLASIQLACERAGDLCRQLLVYAGRGTIEHELIDLNVVVREMVGLLRASIPKKIAIITQLSDSPAIASADPTRIRQLIMNLVINGAEAIGERTGRVIVSTSVRDDDVSLVVDDNGEGMDAETIARIYEPFFSQKFEGRGLGLAMVERTAEAHGGRIEVQSDQGKGTRFVVTLPRTRATAEAEVAPEPAREGAPPTASILFVDDEDVIRRTGAALLRKSNFSVAVAENGADAVRAVEEKPEEFDCVVLDLTMPVMGGVEALAEIRRIKPGLHVILCSGYTSQPIEDLLADDPHTVFISKPYHPNRLLAAIAQGVSQDD